MGGEAIRLADVAAEVGFRIYRHRTDIYSVLKSALEREVDRRLLAREAERRGVSVNALREQEIDRRAQPATAADVDAYLREHPEDAKLGPEARPRIRHYLTERRRNQLELALTRRLRRRAGYELVLEAPEMPRVELDDRGAPARGPASAPVTVVHFASLSQPRSARSADKLARLMKAFPGEIRWVHRHALAGRDERGLAAGRLAELAASRGLFWKLHDRLVDAGGARSAADLDAVAADLGLDREALDGDRFLAAVKRDVDAGRRVGVDRPPAVFVNGRYFSPTFSYQKLEALVRAELSSS